MEVCPVQEIIPGCKAVLNIGVERAANLDSPIQQASVKPVKDDSILVGFDAREAWVDAEEVSITQARTQSSFEPPCLQAHGGCTARPAGTGFEICCFCKDIRVLDKGIENLVQSDADTCSCSVSSVPQEAL